MQKAWNKEGEMRVACAIALTMFGMRYAVVEEGLADRRTRIWCAGGWFLLSITLFLLATKILLGVMNAQMAWLDRLQEHPQVLATVLFLSLMFAFMPVVLFFIAPIVIWAFLVAISIGLLLLGFAAAFGYHNRSHLEVPRPLS